MPSPHRATSLLQLLRLSILLVTLGCTKTKMTSIKDPDAPATPYKRILVVAAFSDLESRDRVENRFVKSLA